MVNSAATATVTAAVVTTEAVKSEPTEAQTGEVPKEIKQMEVKEQSEETLEQASPVAADGTIATVTVLDNAEKDRLSQEIALLQEKIQRSDVEVTRYRKELEEGKEHISTLEGEVSHLGKEKARFEKQAAENKQVCAKKANAYIIFLEEFCYILFVSGSIKGICSNVMSYYIQQ